MSARARYRNGAPWRAAVRTESRAGGLWRRAVSGRNVLKGAPEILPVRSMVADFRLLLSRRKPRFSLAPFLIPANFLTDAGNFSGKQRSLRPVSLKIFQKIFTPLTLLKISGLNRKDSPSLQRPFKKSWLKVWIVCVKVSTFALAKPGSPGGARKRSLKRIPYRERQSEGSHEASPAVMSVRSVEENKRKRKE